MNNFILPHKIRFYRKQLGLTQEQLAHISDITKDYLGAIERGEVFNVSIVKLTNLAKALRVHVSDLLPPKTKEEAA